MIAMPDVGSFTPAALEAERRLVRLRRHRRGRGVAVLPADDPAPPDRARAQARASSSRSARARVLPRRARRRTAAIEIADPLDTLEQPCYDIRALTRNFDFVSDGLAQRQHARLGQLRDRPRGRQRPVRAELRLRRRAHHLRPRGLLPLHGRGDGAGARADRDLHAEAVRPPDRQRLPLPHEPLGRRHEPLPATRTTRAASGSRETAYHFIGGLKKHARAYIALTAPTVNSYKRLMIGAPTSGATWAPAYVTYGYNNRTQMLRIPGARADRGPDGRRLLQPLPGRDGGPRRGPRRDRERARPRRPELGEHVRDPYDELQRHGDRDAAREPARRDPRARGRRGAARRRSAAARDEDYVDYFIRCKRRRVEPATTSRSRNGRSRVPRRGSDRMEEPAP